MKFTVSKKALKEAIDLIGVIVNKKSLNERMRCIQITAMADCSKVTLHGVNISFNVAVEVDIECKDVSDGVVLANAAGLASLVKSLDSGSIVIEARQTDDGYVLFAEQENASSAITAMDDELVFDKISNHPCEFVPITPDAQEFAKTLKMMIRYASDDEMRQALALIEVNVQNGELSLLATNGYVATERKTRKFLADELGDTEYQFPIKVWAAQVLQKSAAMSKLAPVVITRSKIDIFQDAFSYMYAVVPDPKSGIAHVRIHDFFSVPYKGIGVREVIPKTFKSQYIVDLETFRSAVKRVSPSGRIASSVHLSFFKDGRLSLVVRSLKANATSSASTMILVKKVVEAEREEFKMVMDFSFLETVLLGILKTGSDVEDITIELTKSVRPMVIRYTEGEDEIVCALMPMYSKELAENE